MSWLYHISLIAPISNLLTRDLFNVNSPNAARVCLATATRNRNTRYETAPGQKQLYLPILVELIGGLVKPGPIWLFFRDTPQRETIATITAQQRGDDCLLIWPYTSFYQCQRHLEIPTIGAPAIAFGWSLKAPSVHATNAEQDRGLHYLRYNIHRA